MGSPESIKSPCIHVCTHDTDGICLGCYRSIEEIRKWHKCNNDEKRAILANTEKRRSEKDRNNRYQHYV